MGNLRLTRTSMWIALAVFVGVPVLLGVTMGQYEGLLWLTLIVGWIVLYRRLFPRPHPRRA